MAKSEKGLLFFYDWRAPFQELSGEECKALLLAMLDYSQNDVEPPEFEGSAKIAASFLFPALMRSKQCAKAGRAGGLVTASSGASSIASSESQPQNKTRHKQKPNTNENERRFAAFWEIYPRKVGKDAARKAFEKISPDDALLLTISSALERHKQSKQWTTDGGQFIPHPSTWLNQKRWEDELPEETISGERTAPDYSDAERYSNIKIE